MANSTKTSTEVVLGDTVDNFIRLDPNTVFVPDGRMRDLNNKNVKAVADSIKNLGQLQPIQIDKNKNLIDGNHRLNACILLGIDVIAQVVDEFDTDKLMLMEIDSNLCRQELSPKEYEAHLAERKRLYLKLYPETAKGKGNSKKAKGEDDEDTEKPASFVEDTAKMTGKSKKTIERAIKRGENAGDELNEAREKGEISTSDIDEIIKETGNDVDKQKEKLIEKLKQKALPKKGKETPKEEEADTRSEVAGVNYKELYDKLLEEVEALNEVIATKDKTIEALKKQVAEFVESM